MLVTRCDNKKCNKLSDKEMDKVTIKISNNSSEKVELDLWDECITELLKFIDNGFSTEIGKQIKVKRKKRKSNTGPLIEKYGHDRLVSEYTSNIKKPADLASEIGISTVILYKYLRENGIKKKTKGDSSQEVIGGD